MLSRIEQLIADRLVSMSSDQFEQVCCALVRSIGFLNVHRRGHHYDRDQGRDVEAVYPRILPDGRNQITERWFFECKHQTRNLNVDDIQNKVAWAEAAQADFLVFLSSADLTSNARQYISEFQAHHKLKILSWTGEVLTGMINQSLSVLGAYFPELLRDPLLQAQVEAEDRIRLARKILTSIDVIKPDLDATRFMLLQEIISRCVRKEHVRSVAIESLEDGASEVVYLLGASGNRVLNEAEVCKTLRSILERHPGDDITWQATTYLRARKRDKGKVALRYLLIGPIASGKSCLLTALLFRMLGDKRLTFGVDTLLELSGMHRALREWNQLPPTQPPGPLGFRMYVSKQKRFRQSESCIEFADLSGEVFNSFHKWESVFTERIEGGIRPGDIVLLVFDPTGGGFLPENGRFVFGPSMFEPDIFDKYSDFVEWSRDCGLTVVPTVTKIDLISSETLRREALYAIRSLFPGNAHPIFTTSVMMMKNGSLIPQTFGIDEIIAWIVDQL
jgi:hypothetical protein